MGGEGDRPRAVPTEGRRLQLLQHHRAHPGVGGRRTRRRRDEPHELCGGFLGECPRGVRPLPVRRAGRLPWRDPAAERLHTGRRHAALYQLTDPARQRFERLAAEDREAAELFRADLHDYVRKYGFLSQVMQFVDPGLEALYLFGRHLLNRLPRRQDPAVDIGQVDLTHLRVSKTGEHDLALEPEGPQVLPGFDGGVGVLKDPETATLAEIIEEFNQRYGLGLSEADRVNYAERIVAATEDPKLNEAAVASRNEADFELPFETRFREIMVERAEADTRFTEKFFSDNEFAARLTREARRAAYRMIRRRHNLPVTTT